MDTGGLTAPELVKMTMEGAKETFEKMSQEAKEAETKNREQVELINQDIPEPLEMLKMLKFNDNEIYEERIKHQKKNIVIREKLEQAKNNIEYRDLLQ